MAAQPTVLPEFATSGLNVLEPTPTQKIDGWVATQKPPHTTMNWLHKITNDWLEWFATVITYVMGLTTYILMIKPLDDGASVQIKGGDGVLEPGGDILITAGDATDNDKNGGNLVLVAGVGNGTGDDGIIKSQDPHYFANGNAGITYYSTGIFTAKIKDVTPTQEVNFAYERIGNIVTINWEDIIILAGQQTPASYVHFVAPAANDMPADIRPPYIPGKDNIVSTCVASFTDTVGIENGTIQVNSAAETTRFTFYPNVRDSLFDVTKEHGVLAGSVTYSLLYATP